MDNITHTLIGVAVAETVCRIRKVKGPQRIPVFVGAIAASSFPDLDLVFQLVDPTPVGYLLNHRGHTHSFLAIVPQLFLLMSLFGLYSKWRTGFRENYDKAAVISAMTVGLTLHMVMDYMNPYGTHLLSPFDNRWYSSDSIYIIEPWLWAALFPLALTKIKKLWVKIPLAVLPIMAVAVAAKLGIVSFPIAGAMILTALGLYFLHLRRAENFHAAVPWVLIAAILLAFQTGASAARKELRAAYDSSRGYELKDIALAPRPGDPRCWSYLAVETDGTTYRVESGSYAHSQASCPSLRSPNAIDFAAPTKAAFLPRPEIQEHGEFSMPLAELVSESKTHCRVAGWFRFARVPHKEGSVYNDLRYGLRNRQNFSTYDSKKDAPDSCPPLDVPWIPPRRDILPD